MKKTKDTPENPKKTEKKQTSASSQQNTKKKSSKKSRGKGSDKPGELARSYKKELVAKNRQAKAEQEAQQQKQLQPSGDKSLSKTKARSSDAKDKGNKSKKTTDKNPLSPSEAWEKELQEMGSRPPADATVVPQVPPEAAKAPQSPEPPKTPAAKDNKPTSQQTRSGALEHPRKAREAAKQQNKLQSKLPANLQAEHLKKVVTPEEWKQYKMVGMMFLVALLCGLSFSLMQYLNHQDNHVQTVLYLDVNPSISLSLNQKNQVMSVTTENHEAEVMLGSSDFVGLTVDEALSKLVGLLQLHGYLTQSSTILATIEDSDETRGTELSVEVKETLDRHLLTVESDVDTVGMWVDPRLDYNITAEGMGISMGKLLLLEELSKVSYFLQVSTLHDYSYSELYQLYASGEPSAPIGLYAVMELAKHSVQLSDFDQFALEITPKLLDETPQYEVLFQTATMEYLVRIHAFEGTTLEVFQRQATSDIIGIFPNKAKEIALSHVGKLELQVTGLQVEQDWSKGRLQYLVYFNEGDIRHNVQISAVTEDVLDYYVSEVSPESIKDIGQTAIQDLVFSEAGVSRNQLTANTFQRNAVDGVMIYEMNFAIENREFFYEVAGDGTILHSYYVDTGEPEAEATEEIAPLSETNAKDLALEHAGVVFSQVRDLQATEQDNGDYEIQFILEDWLYRYLVSAEQGKVVSYEKEVAEYIPPVTTMKDIGEDGAKLLALSHANLKEVMIQQFDIEVVGEDEEKVYHVNFSFGNYQFIYQVDATTGDILHNEQVFIPMEPTTPETPEVEASPELSESDFDQLMEDFNNTLLEFDSNMSSLWNN